MTVALSNVCTRCNKLTADGDRCTRCGSPVKTLENQKRRGWLALGAGAFLVVFMSAIWIWMDRLFAAAVIAPNEATSQFLGRINVAFGLVVIAGILGMINGWVMARSGRRNMPLIVGLILAFSAAVFLTVTASNGYRGS